MGPCCGAARLGVHSTCLPIEDEGEAGGMVAVEVGHCKQPEDKHQVAAGTRWGACH